VAHAAGKDPVEMRLQLIGTTQPPAGNAEDEKPVDIKRLKAVLDLAVSESGLGTQLPRGRGRGIACLSSWGSYIAQVAEVTVEKDGSIRVNRVVVAIDCGQVINPDMVAAQMEGGICFGLTAALYGDVTLENGQVQQSNFNNYQMLRIGGMPRIEVHIVPSHEAPGGVGEPPVPSIAPAVANAIFAATGKRLRRLPFQTEELAQT
jgi:isoquinoline 1-oxidoreductase beta subunit